jgi:hypothetical protein
VQIQEILDEIEEKVVDPCAMLMDVTLYDSENLFMNWLANPTSESTPSNEEYSDDGYASPCPTVLKVGQRKREGMVFMRKITMRWKRSQKDRMKRRHMERRKRVMRMEKSERRRMIVLIKVNTLCLYHLSMKHNLFNMC